ncbi:MAG: histidinol-phosphatase HisJ [Turicibacter sp.]|nr:histidinol-phosphatase HisJ [Turicibacter sp.]
MSEKWDGHSHTQFCLHGAVEDVEQLIQRAISRGFTKYSITEHAPMPKGFYEKAGGPKWALETAGMEPGAVERYLKTMHGLKKKYASQIELLIGMEYDYLPEFNAWTTDFLNEYGGQMDDGILSVHFLPGNEGLRVIDESPGDYKDGLLDFYGNFQAVQEAYLERVYGSIMADLGPHKPKRIGHVSLARKFKNAFPHEDTGFSQTSMDWYQKIFTEMERQNLAMDMNMAGLFKDYCQEPYPPKEILNHFKPKVKKIYGSDSHHLDDVERGYEVYREMMGGMK